jgi:hypothetical protein
MVEQSIDQLEKLHDPFVTPKILVALEQEGEVLVVRPDDELPGNLLGRYYIDDRIESIDEGLIVELDHRVILPYICQYTSLLMPKHWLYSYLGQQEYSLGGKAIEGRHLPAPTSSLAPSIVRALFPSQSTAAESAAKLVPSIVPDIRCIDGGTPSPRWRHRETGGMCTRIDRC